MKILMAAMGLDIGGAETHIVELTRSLSRMGHEVTVASNGGVYVPEIEAAGARHIVIPMHRRSPALMMKSLGLLKKAVRDTRPDVVHAHARIPAFLCGILQKRMGFPLVTTAHWVFAAGGAAGALTNWGDRTVAVSEDIKRYLMDSYGVPEERISVTINGIDTEKFSPAVSGEAIRREFGIAPETPVVAHVSRLDESRADAAAALIEAAPKIAGHFPGAVVLIAGGGDVFDKLRSRAEAVNAALGRSCVILTGPRTDVNAVCAAGDVFVGVSRAALEAMAAAKPVVIAGNEGTMGLFDETKLQTGIEGNFCCRGCPLLTKETLLEDVLKALSLPVNERQRLSAFGRRVVLEHYSVERMAKDALYAYREARAGGRVVLSGYYGYGNAGDEAILRALIASVRSISPKARITVLSRDARATEKSFGVEAVPRFSPVKVPRALRQCDLLVSGGGSLLQDNTSTRSLLYYLGILRLALRLGKRTFIYANGIGPVRREKNRARVRAAAERVDAVTLRDPDSLKELRDMGVAREDLTVTADPVFTLPEPDPERTRAILRENGVEGDYIAVSVRPYNKGGAGYFDDFAAVCDEAARRFGVTPLFVNMQGAVDAAVSESVRRRMREKSAVLAGDFTPEELMGVIGESRAVLSMRLHALIFAARCAVPALGFVYDPKVRSYLELLRQPSAGDGGIDRDAALEALAGLLERREEVTASLTALRDGLAEKAGANGELLRKLLDV